MVLCSETAGGRAARIAPLDQLLIDHATEYHCPPSEHLAQLAA